MVGQRLLVAADAATCHYSFSYRPGAIGRPMPFSPGPLSHPLSDALPIPPAIAHPLPTAIASRHQRCIATPSFSPTAVTVADLLPSLACQAHHLPRDTTYQALAQFFRAQPAALGVMIFAPGEHRTDSGRLPEPIAMVSRQRWQQWRSQRTQ